jgi:general secretion pathway protein D
MAQPALNAAPVPAPTASAPAAATGVGASQTRAGGPVTLNFVNAEIEAVARAMATITGRNVLVDPRVKGTMSLSTERAVPPAAAYNQFLAALRLQGYAVVESAGLSKVVPEADAKLQSGSVNTVQPRTGSGQIATQIFRLNHENANNLVPILRPLISPNNTINVNPGNNSLVITDYGDNLQRMGRIIAALDIPNASDVEVIPLQHAIASELLPLITRLSSEASGPAAPGQVGALGGAVVLAEPRSNAIILRAANPARTSLIRTLIAKLDQPGASAATGNIRVVHLKNADAVRVATTLRAALAAETSGAGGAGAAGAASPQVPRPAVAAGAAGGTGASQQATAPTTQAAQPSTGGNIQADPATNSLIITASEPQYRQIRAVIDMLDSRRAQVFIESLIAEVNADKAAEFGVQWQGALGNKGDGNIGLLGTNFGSGGNNIIDLALGAASGAVKPGTGLNYGIARQTNGVYVLGFLARFLQSNGAGNILSTPNLLTLDNEEAKIVIGQNVPFVTGQFTNTGGGNNGSVNPFQTIERKDVGLTLRVKPQISENGTVKMEIFQEVSSVDPASRNAATGLITNKRSIESSILVEDGGIVVLGGLLQDEYSNNQEKVPLLGDVPLFGNLFRSETRSRKKTNLMVFLRPVVLRDAQSSENLALDRYDIMRVLQKEAQPTPSVTVPVNEAPVLPTQAQPFERQRSPATVPLGQPPVEKSQ